jgi:hypothetical protein
LMIMQDQFGAMLNNTWCSNDRTYMIMMWWNVWAMIDDLAVIDIGAIIYDRWINDHRWWWKMHEAIVEDGAMMDGGWWMVERWWWGNDHGWWWCDDIRL